MVMKTRAYYDSELEKFGRKMLCDVYDKLTEPEKRKFKLIFKVDAGGVKAESVKDAYSICARTINLRKEKADG